MMKSVDRAGSASFLHLLSEERRGSRFGAAEEAITTGITSVNG